MRQVSLWQGGYVEEGAVMSKIFRGHRRQGVSANGVYAIHCELRIPNEQDGCCR
jgi:hypothetical protein